MIVVVQENHEDQREMLAADKLCLGLLNVLIHLIKIISFHAIYVYFILHLLFVLLMVLFSKRFPEVQATESWCTPLIQYK